MWMTVLIATARAQSLDLAALEAAERADRAEYERLASQKRQESITRLKGLMDRGVNPETLAEMRLRLADLYWQEGVAAGMPDLVEKAARLYEQLLRDFPRYEKAPAATYSLGRCHAFMGRIEEARGQFQQVARAFPSANELAPAYLMLGELYALEGNDIAAHKAYEKYAAWIDAERHDYGSYRLGWTSHRLGDDDKSRQLLTQAAGSADAHVAAAAGADFAELFGTVVPAPPPPPPPPGCPEIEHDLRERITREPDQAPALQLEIVRCWAEVDRGRALGEVARMEQLYGKKSPWAKARDKASVRGAADLIREAQAVVNPPG